jgi:glycosyltransferase involved in cell wall biosynthesis
VRVTAPTVSVIIPTRNRPEFLRAAVESVCAQTFPAAEILVVDDGGGASEALRGIAGVRVLAGRGAGPGAARNVGLEAAGGELIAFLDDDDRWHPEKLAWQVQWMQRRTELGVLGTGVVRSADALPSLRLRSRPRRLRPVGRAALVRANRLTTSSVMVRRECFAICGAFDETLLLAQDWELWLRIARRWPLASLPAPLTTYRLHDNQRSARGTEMRRWEARVVAQVMAGEERELQGVARRRLAWAQCRLGRGLLREQTPGPAAQALRQSLALFPLNPLTWGALARCALHQLAMAGAARL